MTAQSGRLPSADEVAAPGGVAVPGGVAAAGGVVDDGAGSRSGSAAVSPEVVGRWRKHLVALLERDAAYDRAPEGAPPVRGPDYRRALFAVLELAVVRAACEPSVPVSEFEAGRRSSAVEVMAVLAAALAPQRLRPRTRTTRRPVDDGPDEGSETSG